MDDGRPPETRRGWQPVVGKFFAGILALGVATCSIFLDVHKIAWYAVFPYSYYIEIKTHLTVDGEPLEVTGVAQCNWVQRLKPMFVHVVGSSFDGRGGILAKRLPSGGAVIVLVRPPCGTSGDPSGFGPPKSFWKETQPLDAPVRHLPVQTLLLDDASAPTRIEWSFSKAYFADPRARIQYIGGTYLPKRSARRPDPRDVVPWLGVKSGSSKTWAGFFAEVTPREVWSHWGGWATVLESLTDVTRLTGEYRIPSKAFQRSDRTVRSLFLMDGYWDYRPDAPATDGMVMLYPRRDPVAGETIPANRRDTIFGAQSRLSVKGRPTGITPPMYSRALYEPEGKTIFFILGDAVSVSANEVQFNRGSNTLSGRLFKF